MKYDVAIIGGGPAGMMSAGRAGELGARVVLLEKNSQLGIKLLSTGGGRCNFTNHKSNRELASSFGKSGAWLLSGLSKFGPEEVIKFFNNRGLRTKVEENGRVFPVSNLATDVLRVLTDYLKSSAVEVRLSAEVKDIVKVKNKISKIILSNGEEIVADKFVMCVGGKSYPLTGSTGDGYKWLKKLGHSIVDLRPALTPIILKETFIKDLEGLSLPVVGLTIYKNNKKALEALGPIVFTRQGLSGPLILNLSSEIGLLGGKNLPIQLDFLPDLDKIQLDKKLQQEFASSNKVFKNAVSQLVPPKLVGLIVRLSGISPQKKLNSITKEERQILGHLLKEFALNLDSLAGYDLAMISAGGVDLKEVDPKTMKSKIIDNLYLAGEILNLNGPTGGYNLQLCWTTGYVAGESGVRHQKRLRSLN